MKLTFYLNEIASQVEYAKYSFIKFEEFYKNKDIPKTFMSIHHFLIHISNIDKILDADKNEFRRKIIGNTFDGINLKPFRRMRNHLEHFDERMDNWIKNHQGNAIFDMNFIKGTKGFPDKVFLRALDDYTLKFYGESYDLNEMMLILSEIENRLETVPY